MGSSCWKELLNDQQFNAYYINFGAHLTWDNLQEEAAPTFQNRERLYQFSKRMDLYSVWIDSAMVYMKKEC
jgi:hypothetical protein